MSGKQRTHPYLQRWMKTWFSFKQAPHGADMEKLAHLCSLIKGCWWRWTVPGHICKNALWGLWKQMLAFHLWAHYWISFFFFLWKIMTLPSSLMSSFRADLVLHGLLSIVWNRTAIQVPAQRRTSLCWNTSMSRSRKCLLRAVKAEKKLSGSPKVW